MQAYYIHTEKKRHKTERTQKLMGDTIHVKEQGLEFQKMSYKNPVEKQNQTKLKIHRFFLTHQRTKVASKPTYQMWRYKLIQRVIANICLPTAEAVTSINWYGHLHGKFVELLETEFGQI